MTKIAHFSFLESIKNSVQNVPGYKTPVSLNCPCLTKIANEVFSSRTERSLSPSYVVSADCVP